MRIREYRPEDEEGWLRCRVLAFLHSAYYDNVLREKERYRYPAIELVAELDGTIVGLIDLECEAPGTVCSDRPGLAAMIWHLAVHPDCRGRGHRPGAPGRGRGTGEGARDRPPGGLDAG